MAWRHAAVRAGGGGEEQAVRRWCGGASGGRVSSRHRRGKAALAGRGSGSVDEPRLKPSELTAFARNGTGAWKAKTGWIGLVQKFLERP
mmetsp:Transcript_2268/g.4326  ORF Transcript_2268/g.4326 Transcript_2268/m.4326 type:complete len:89 (-) Transcript_2268:2774-3040(-)